MDCWNCKLPGCIPGKHEPCMKRRQIENDTDDGYDRLRDFGLLPRQAMKKSDIACKTTTYDDDIYEESEFKKPARDRERS